MLTRINHPYPVDLERIESISGVELAYGFIKSISVAELFFCRNLFFQDVEGNSTADSSVINAFIDRQTPSEAKTASRRTSSRRFCGAMNPMA
jgi:hypothetical protein